MASAFRCWDSDAILAWLQKEDGKWEKCDGVLQAAEKETVRIVVSSLAIAEVLMLPKHESIPKNNAQTVRDFFRRSFIIVRQLDRATAELAQELVWDYGIAPKDAVHVATALMGGVPNLDTFDKELISKSGNIAGRNLVIGHPDIPLQGSFVLGTSDEQAP